MDIVALQKTLRERSANMAQHYQKTSTKKKPSNVYKTGKLTRSTKFTSTRINKKWLILFICLVATFLFAIILGNILGDIAHNSQSNINNAGSSSSLGTPSVDKTSPKIALHAYFADMSSADPSVSLSEQTGAARERGNSLFFNMQYDGGKLIYSSPKASELG